MDDRLDDLARLDADVERDADVVLELRLGAAQRRERGDGRQLPRPVVEPGAAEPPITQAYGLQYAISREDLATSPAPLP